jgi:hypothetical protein
MNRNSSAKMQTRRPSAPRNVEMHGTIDAMHRKPVAGVSAIRARSPGLIGSMAGKIKIKGNIRRTGLKWEAEH